MNNAEVVTYKMRQDGILPEDVDRYIGTAKIIVNAGISISSVTNVSPFYAMDMLLHTIKTIKEQT